MPTRQQVKEWVCENSRLVATAAIVVASAGVVAAAYKVNSKNFELLEKQQDYRQQRRDEDARSIARAHTNALEILAELKQNRNPVST